MPVALPQKNLRAACPLLVLALWFALLAPIGAAEKQRPLELHLRSKVETSAASGRYHTLTQPATWDAGQTAVVICDMWDKHWCDAATRRVAQMAPRMNEVVAAARRQGVLIIHCPSGCMDYYKDTPQRKLAQQAPPVETEIPLERWCHLDPEQEASLPIDDSDEGCDSPGCKPHKAWSKQIDTIEIEPGDAITDSAEAFYLMRQRGIENVIVMGVHTNMCVLGRPFSIRQMVRQGQNVVLVRDMTDTMYNPEMPPQVSHFSGTDLVIDHIEKYWCPTVTSAAFLGGQEFRFPADRRPHLAIVMAEREYGTKETLPALAAKYLHKEFRVSYVFANEKDRNDLPGIEVLQDADLALFSIRRRTPPAEQMQIIRDYITSGKPLVAIRTSSHAFALRGSQPPEGHAAWQNFDEEILGAHYNLHYPGKASDGASTAVWTVPAAADHPILQHVPSGELTTSASLYRHRPLAESATPLMMGRFGENPVEPVAWVNKTKHGGRVFYTMLGHRDDFAQTSFQRLLVNGIYWAAGKEPPEELKADQPAGEADGNSAKADSPGKEAAASAASLTPDWTEIPVPGVWDDALGGKFAAYDGFAWYRCGVQVSESWAETDLALFVEKVDNAHECYVNGKKVGGAGQVPPDFANGWDLAQRYQIPAGLLQENQVNVIAIRVYDRDGRGGFKGLAPALFNERLAIDLTGPWQFRLGDDPGWAKLAAGESLPEAAIYAKVEKAAEIEPRWVSDLRELGGLPPEEAAKKLEVHSDFTLQQVLTEPESRQPLQISFDERGRLWLVQYLQYPHPAGLKMVSRDNYWRAVYDRVLEPPPHHVPGKDKITIHEDTDGDGVYDKHKTFVDGLNITTSCARGRGGVWVLSPPHLLFYPDKDNDDTPDGDPVVHLEGFGLEDTHSVTNSLRWGPDGWLYATQGSTVSAAVKRTGLDKKPLIKTMGQLVWRYHPESRRYEIFAEGGGNAFGLALDAKGRIFSGHNGGNTRGFHYVQGGYYRKGFSKHGPLSNPYAFGFFDAMAHHDVPRFSHTFAIYESGLPDKYQGKLFGVEPLQSQIVVSEVMADRSSLKTKDLFRPIESGDRWFRPVDIKEGPDGALYIADWYDGQVNHYRNHEGRIDPTNGRIYRLAASAKRHELPSDYGKLPGEELIPVLRHPSKWHRQTALRILGDRKDRKLLPSLEKMLFSEKGQTALEALWAINLTGGLDDELALRALGHGEPYVRQWTVRLLCDPRQVAPPVAGALAALAADEPHVEVRSQLACSARRLSAEQGLPIVRRLLAHREDIDDIHLPLLLWWAIETHCEASREEVLALLQDEQLWEQSMVREHILERLMRRFAMAGGRRDLLTCARLLELAPDQASADKLMQGFEAAFKGRSLASLPDALVEQLARVGGGSLVLRLRRGEDAALVEALRVIADEKAPLADRQELVQTLGEVQFPSAVPVLLEALEQSKQPSLQESLLVALQRYQDTSIAPAIVAMHNDLPPEVQAVAQSQLASRVPWARQLLSAIDSGQVEKSAVQMTAVRKILLHGDKASIALVRKHWGNVGGETTEQMQQQIERLKQVVLAGYGSPYKGKLIFKQNCAKCHTLFGEGGRVGPNLTSYKRDDLANMLLNIVNPSAEIREGYENFMVLTEDGRALSGFIADQDNQVLVLKGPDGQSITLPRDEIDELKPLGRSVMPEGALKPLSDQQIRDLFAYLRSTQPLNN